MIGVKIKNTLISDFSRSTQDELSHIEKVITNFIKDTKAINSMVAQHADVILVDDSVSSLIPQETSFQNNQNSEGIGEVETRIQNTLQAVTKTHSNFVEAFIGTEYG